MFHKEIDALRKKISKYKQLIDKHDYFTLKLTNLVARGQNVVDKRNKLSQDIALCEYILSKLEQELKLKQNKLYISLKNDDIILQREMKAKKIKVYSNTATDFARSVSLDEDVIELENTIIECKYILNECKSLYRTLSDAMNMMTMLSRFVVAREGKKDIII